MFLPPPDAHHQMFSYAMQQEATSMKSVILLLTLVLIASCGGSSVPTPTPDLVPTATLSPTATPAPATPEPVVTEECEYVREVLVYLQLATESVLDQVYAQELEDTDRYSRNNLSLQVIEREVASIPAPPTLELVRTSALEALSFTTNSQYQNAALNGRVNDWIVERFTTLVAAAHTKAEAAIGLHCPK
jgi:hypothetical protein